MTASTTARHPRSGPWLRGGLRGTLVAAAAVSAVLAGTGAASAHVKVSGVDATRGGYGVLTFRVPTESATASTTRLRIAFPTDTPISSVATQPVPGWTATLVTKKLRTPVQTDDGKVTTYVAEVDWKADSGRDAIHPGEFQMFSVSAGPLPDAASVAFPTVQYYSDGTKVAWNESSSAGAEPEHPAPVLDLAPAAGGGSASTAPDASGSSMPGMDTSHSQASSGDGDSDWPGLVGLIAGVLGLVAGGLALARTTRVPSSGR